MSRRILLLTQWFDPEPTPIKGLIFARELRKRGFEVDVLTGIPNYPGGKFYSGYRIKLLQREFIDGIQVVRVPLYPSHDGSAIKRIFNYLSFAASALIYGLFFMRKVDVIYAYHPPLTVGFTAVIIKFFRRIPVVYDIQDIWPDTLKATGMLNASWALSLIDVSCRWVYGQADHLVVLSPGFKKLLVSRGVPLKKIDVIYNWSDEHSLLKVDEPTPSIYADNGQFYILFSGNIGRAQGLDNVLEAANILQQSYPLITFLILGDGVELINLKSTSINMGLKNVIFLPSVPVSKVGAYLRAADALLVHLRSDPLFEITIPSKTQSYMSVGKPLIMAVKGDAANLVQESECGVVIPPESPQLLAQAAIKMSLMSSSEMEKMGAKGLEFYRYHLCLKVGVDKFSNVFSRYCGKHHPVINT